MWGASDGIKSLVWKGSMRLADHWEHWILPTIYNQRTIPNRYTHVEGCDIGPQVLVGRELIEPFEEVGKAVASRTDRYRRRRNVCR